MVSSALSAVLWEAPCSKIPTRSTRKKRSTSNAQLAIAVALARLPAAAHHHHLLLLTRADAMVGVATEVEAEVLIVPEATAGRPP